MQRRVICQSWHCSSFHRCTAVLGIPSIPGIAVNSFHSTEAHDFNNCTHLWKWINLVIYTSFTIFSCPKNGLLWIQRKKQLRKMRIRAVLQGVCVSNFNLSKWGEKRKEKLFTSISLPALVLPHCPNLLKQLISITYLRLGRITQQLRDDWSETDSETPCHYITLRLHLKYVLW